MFADLVLSFWGICILVYARVSLGSISKDLRHLLWHHPRKLAGLMSLYSWVRFVGRDRSQLH